MRPVEPVRTRGDDVGTARAATSQVLWMGCGCGGRSGESLGPAIVVGGVVSVVVGLAVEARRRQLQRTSVPCGSRCGRVGWLLLIASSPLISSRGDGVADASDRAK